MNEDRKQFMVENARIFWPNFSGKEGRYNSQGTKNFCIALTQDVADHLIQEGWNVKYATAREEGDPDEPYISIEARYDKYPPKVVLINGRQRTHLDKDTIEILDWANIKQADLIVNGSDWMVNGKAGVKAYLRSLFVTIEEDYLEKKYAVQEPE